MRHLFVWIVTAVSALIAGMATTAGAIVNPTVPPIDYTAGGGISTFPIGTGQTGAVLISANPGRLQRVLITTANASNSITFYDGTSTSSQSGATIIGYIPASATLSAAGIVFTFQMPAKYGIVAVMSAAGIGATVSYS